MSAAELRRVPIADLHANAGNVREHLDGIDELAASIRTNGLLQPLIVNQRGSRLVVTDGHRRLAAARLAGVPALLCIVTTGADEQRVLTTMLAAAMHRELRPIEQARAFERLKAQGMATADVARATGYSVALIRARLLLLDLPVEAQEMVEDERLTLGQATELAKQVRAKKTGSVARIGSGSEAARYWKSHPLRDAVRDLCTHREIRRSMGAAGCPPCWERVIRADERRAARGDVAS